MIRRSDGGRLTVNLPDPNDPRDNLEAVPAPRPESATIPTVRPQARA
jgi:hypothetical protein